MKSTTTESAPVASTAPCTFSKARPLAARVGVHPKTLFRWAEQGLIHKYKVNQRIVLFDPAEVLALIESARVA